MSLGKIVEMTDRETFYRDPQHLYAQPRMSAIPIPNPALKRRWVVLAGDVPSPLRPPPGCRFHQIQSFSTQSGI